MGVDGEKQGTWTTTHLAEDTALDADAAPDETAIEALETAELAEALEAAITEEPEVIALVEDIIAMDVMLESSVSRCTLNLIKL